MNCSIPSVVKCPLKYEDNLVIHVTHPFEAFSHDLVGITMGLNFFLRISSVADLNGKGKLGVEEDALSRECVDSGPGKG